MHKKVLGILLFCGLIIAVIAAMPANATSVLSPMEELGKEIFFDTDLSINQNQSCATCHAPEAGWVGPHSDTNAHGAVYEGSIAGRFGDRKPPSSAYATTSPIFHFDGELFIGGNFWDGRATGEKLGNPAADQAQGPFLNRVEQGLADSACVVYRVCTASYPVSFTSVWGASACAITWPANVETECALEGHSVMLSDPDQAKSNMAYDQIALSIAAYEGSIEVNAFSSKWDYSRINMARLDKVERLGFALFQGKGKCKLCHVTNGPQPLLTDYSFDNLGIPKNPENPIYNVFPNYIDTGLGGFLMNEGYLEEVYMAEWGKQKVPTLRNVALAPEGVVKAYGHNGYFKTLEGIVHFYNTRDILPTCPGDYTEAEALADNCWPLAEVMLNVNTAELGDLGLSYGEELAIVAFLKTLDDGYMP